MKPRAWTPSLLQWLALIPLIGSGAVAGTGDYTAAVYLLLLAFFGVYAGEISK